MDGHGDAKASDGVGKSVSTCLPYGSRAGRVDSMWRKLCRQEKHVWLWSRNDATSKRSSLVIWDGVASAG